MLPQREALLNMDYDFTSVLSRKDTGSAKWNNMYAHSPHVPEGVIPLSLADMELKNPPQIAEGVGAYLRSMNLGYTKPTERFYQAIMDWQKRRNGWNVRPEWIVDYPGVIPALFHLIRFLTEPGDGVILMTPVYYPFYEAVRSCGRSLVESELLYQNGAYTIDFDDLEKKAKGPRNKVLLLCSPHNPVGRLWTHDELERIGDICLKHGVRIVSDEIHSDLVLSSRRHIPIASLSDKLAGITITCNAPSKTFNLAGLATATTIIPDQELRRRFESGMSYSTDVPHYNDPYGYFVVGVASCAGCTRATGLCLNILGISYEHVNENQWGHQWCRVNVNGTYWICDAYGLYCGPEPAPYTHPYL